MKNLIFFGVCVLIFNSCEPALINGLPRQYYTDNQKIVDISTTAQNRDIIIHHLDEPIGKPHLKVAILEVTGDVNTSYANLILELKERAKFEGVDAISIFKQAVGQQNALDPEGFSVLVAAKEVVAHGIIYRENLDLAGQFPKTQIVYAYNAFEQKYNEVAVRVLDINQQLINLEGKDNLSKIVQPYTVKHLMLDRENWEFYENNGRVEIRIYRNNLGLTKRCEFQYDSLGRVEEVIIKVRQEKLNQTAQYITQKVNFFYDEDNRLFRKMIYPNVDDKVIYYEEIFSYTNDKLKEKTLYSLSEDSRNPIAKFVYQDYYNLEELEAVFPELRE